MWQLCQTWKSRKLVIISKSNTKKSFMDCWWHHSHGYAFLNIVTKMETIFPNMLKVFFNEATNLQLISNPIYTLTSFHNRYQSIKTGEEVCTVHVLHMAALVTQDKTQSFLESFAK